MNRVISETVTVSGKEQTKKIGYDANGNVTSETDVFGNTITYRYNAFNRLLTVVSPEWTTLATYTYDAAGNRVSETDALDNVTTYQYNEAGRVTETKDGEGNVTTTTYDALGNVKSVTDGEGNTTNYDYDEYGHLRSVTAEDETVTEYTYDAAGNLKTQTDGEGHTTEYHYNQAGLVIRRVEDGTEVVTYTYNGDGNVKSMTDANGTVTTYAYNPHGELVSETATGTEGEVSTYTYTYDKAGNLSSMTDESGTTAYTYDELGRVLTKDAPNFGKVTYEYDLTDGMDEGWHYVLQTDGFGTTRTVYDTMNREAKVTTESADGETESAEISYYKNGARHKITYADGSVEEYTFYDNGLVKSVTNTLPDGTVYDRFTYIYDRAGNLKEKVEIVSGEMRGTTTYTYDVQNRLKTVKEPGGTVTTYEYDGAGNRKTETVVSGGTGEKMVSTYTYNGRNQLLSVEKSVDGVVVSKATYTYDANGNQLTETVRTGDTEMTVLTNTYDLRNQLVRSKTEDTVINNTYNAAGYRVGKEVTKDGKTTETYFLYDGSNVIIEADKDGAVKAKNTYAGPLLLRTVQGDSETTYQYMYNAHGDVVTLLTDGEVVATYYYDAFGNILEQTGEVDNSILYAGYQYDVETGLYYLNARMYDPVTARFLQADTYLGNLNDPLSLNLYTYCLNNPNRYVDPSGHIPAILLFLAGRALIGLGAALLSAGMEIVSQKFIEKRTRIDYDLVKFEAISNGVIAMITSGLVNPATLKTGQGGVAAVKTMAKLAAVGAGIGFAEGFTNSVGRQMVMGTRMEDISYSQALGSGITGGLFGIGGEIAGYGLEALKRTRVITNMRNSVSGKISYYANIMKGKFDDVVGKASKVVELDANGQLIINGKSMYFREMDLQFFADSGDTGTTKVFDIVEYGDKTPGLENHHSVLDVWATHNIDGYKSRASKSTTIALTPEQHGATKLVYREWLFERTGKKVGGKVDWTNVSPREIQNLSEKMFDVANVPVVTRHEYYRRFNRYIYGLEK